MLRRDVAAVVLLLSGAGVAQAGPLGFDLGLHLPPVIADSTEPTKCTIIYMIADLTNNDLYAARMRIDSAETDRPVQNRLPCPATVPPRVSLRALDVCTSRTGDSQHSRERCPLQFRQCVRHRRGVLDVGHPVGLQCRMCAFAGGGCAAGQGALRGQAAAQLSDHGDCTSLRSMIRCSDRATDTEWLICDVSSR